MLAGVRSPTSLIRDRMHPGRLCDHSAGGKSARVGPAVWDAQDPCCQSFEEFWEEMVKLFDRCVHGDAASARLARLAQGTSSVTDYSIHFKTLAAACSWNEAALRAQFIDGLSDSIQDEIATH